jgi:hypothetical protein
LSELTISCDGLALKSSRDHGILLAGSRTQASMWYSELIANGTNQPPITAPGQGSRVNYRWSKSKDGEICRVVVFLPDVDSGASQQAGGSLVVILAVENRSLDSSVAFLRNTFHATTVIAIAADIVSPAPEQPHLRNTMIRSSQARRRLKKFNIWSSFAPGPENFLWRGKL